MDIAEIVSSLGGNPRSDDSENLALLANEILILRQKLKEADDSEGRCERRLGREKELRATAERRADHAEAALREIKSTIERRKVQATAAGSPFKSGL